MVRLLSSFGHRQQRFTARTRLAFWYALLMILCGGALLTLMMLFIGYVPYYGFDSDGSDTAQEPLVIAVDDPSIITDDIKIAVESQADLLTLLLR